MSNSNFGDLVQCSPKARSAWRWAKAMGAMTVIVGGAFWCGATTGYWVGVSNERDRAQVELGRLQEAYGLRLEKLADKTVAAADAAITAADAAVSSSEAVEQAAAIAAHKAQRPAPGKHAAPVAAGASTP